MRSYGHELSGGLASARRHRACFSRRAGGLLLAGANLQGALDVAGTGTNSRPHHQSASVSRWPDFVSHDLGSCCPLVGVFHVMYAGRIVEAPHQGSLRFRLGHRTPLASSRRFPHSTPRPRFDGCARFLTAVSPRCPQGLAALLCRSMSALWTMCCSPTSGPRTPRPVSRGGCRAVPSFARRDSPPLVHRDQQNPSHCSQQELRKLRAQAHFHPVATASRARAPVCSRPSLARDRPR